MCRCPAASCATRRTSRPCRAPSCRCPSRGRSWCRTHWRRCAASTAPCPDPSPMYFRIVGFHRLRCSRRPCRSHTAPWKRSPGRRAPRRRTPCQLLVELLAHARHSTQGSPTSCGAPSQTASARSMRRILHASACRTAPTWLLRGPGRASLASVLAAAFAASCSAARGARLQVREEVRRLLTARTQARALAAPPFARLQP
mmetsp:Transcript_118187/g.330963  ORF Transcript_118187/g.330963 Transcript_118187/m.330963 type:complete len:200 (+) Transcript_118187:328-927(+)